jgi:hypothetical protein
LHHSDAMLIGQMALGHTTTCQTALRQMENGLTEIGQMALGQMEAGQMAIGLICQMTIGPMAMG